MVKSINEQLGNDATAIYILYTMYHYIDHLWPMGAMAYRL